jgi:hypothetical protein
MAIVTKYIIRDATNDLFYTENHSIPLSDRWTPNFLSAFLFDTLTDAENEIDVEEYVGTHYIIERITIKQ